MGIVASLSRERSQDGDQAKGGAAQEGDPSNPPPITESPQPLMRMDCHSRILAALTINFSGRFHRFHMVRIGLHYTSIFHFKRQFLSSLDCNTAY